MQIYYFLDREKGSDGYTFEVKLSTMIHRPFWWK